MTNYRDQNLVRAVDRWDGPYPRRTQRETELATVLIDRRDAPLMGLLLRVAGIAVASTILAIWLIRTGL